MSGHVEHSNFCSVPLSEHTGSESCLTYVEDKPNESAAIAHYKQGPQGNMVPDFYADYLTRYGGTDSRRILGTPGISDKRDNRDPEAVYREMHPHAHTLTTAPTHSNGNAQLGA